MPSIAERRFMAVHAYPCTKKENHDRRRPRFLVLKLLGQERKRIIPLVLQTDL